MSKSQLNKSQLIYLPFKRFIDFFGALVGTLICFALLWWWIFIINLFATKGHPLFLQERCGKNCKSFKLIKFRSMKNDADPDLAAIVADSLNLTTPFGKFLRKTSLDETPQLLNILIGQMSFIGPRPLINKSFDTITIQLRKENGSDCIRPGMSGYAQVMERKADSKRRAELDLYYFEHLSFWLDLKVFLKSLF